MMRNSLCIIVATIIVCLITACSNQRVSTTLLDAESIMEEIPDSALKLLESIDDSELTDESKARYALLFSQAYDKNYIDQTDDSLISIATNYYLNTDDLYHTMLSLYYRAVVNRNANLYETSLSDALTAFDIAEQLNNDLYKSRIASIIGKLYSATYNFIETIAWEGVALEYAKILHRPQWIYNGYMNIGEAYLSIGEFDNALEYSDSAVAVFHDYDLDVLELRYSSNFGKKNFAAADSIFKLMEATDNFTPSVQLLSAQCAIDNEVLRKYDISYDDNIVQEHIAAKYIDLQRHLDAKDYEGAFQIINDVIRNQNNETIALTHANLLKIQTDHEATKARIQKMRAKHNKVRLIGVTLLCILIILVLCMSLANIRARHKRIRLQQENDLLYLTREIQCVKQKLDEKNNKITSLKDEVTILSDELSSITQQSALTLVQQFFWVEKFGNMFIDANISTNREKLLYKYVTDSLNTTIDNNFATKIETTIRGINPSIIEEINSMGLIKSEREVLIYLYANFSIRIISLLTKKTPRAIYNLKARIKTKLISFDTEASRALLTLLFS